MLTLMNTLISRLALFLLIVCAQLTRAGENIWTTDGPYGASILAIAIQPIDQSTIIIGSVEHGIYKSTDAGENWRHIESDIMPVSLREIVHHSLSPNTIYACAEGGVFKSTDGGETWYDVSPPGRSGREFRAIVLDPLHPHVILTGGVDDRWKSTDSGQSWAEFSIDPEWPGGPDHEIDGLAVDPVNTNNVYLITSDAEFGKGVYKSTDQGDNWFCIHSNSDSSGGGTDVVVDWANPEIVYYARFDDLRVSGGHCLSKSTDGGGSWFDISPSNLSVWGVFAICVSPWDHNTVFAGTANDGVLKSTDGGDSWSQANTGLNSLVCESFAADFQNHIIYLGLYMDGIYKSIDRANTWRKISQNILGAGLNCLAFVRGSPPRVLATGHMGCYSWSPGGEGWQHIDLGAPLTIRPGAIEVDRDAPSQIYISSYSTSYPLSAPCGLHISTDGGANWAFFNGGLPLDQSFSCMAISYVSNRGRRIFMTAALDWLPSAGIYFSDDTGRGWNRCTNGLPALSYFVLAVAPANPNVVAAAAYNGRIYSSIDMGGSWFSSSNLIWRAIDLEFSPLNDSVLYVSSLSTGIFESTDLGGTWTNITNDLPVDPYVVIYGPAINPHNPQNMYVSSNHHGVYETRDGGQHWTSYNPGIDTARCIGRIFLAPHDTSYLYLATANRSVWSIHRTLTDAVEDDTNLPQSVTLSAYPNPFNARTRIWYTLPQDGNIKIAIYNELGQRLAILFNGPQVGGEHSLTWDATRFPSGTYFTQLQGATGRQTLKMTLVK
ncbi:MAG: hypothetical protein A2W25_00705 [candidate division Zixibacteria bacterium RBG_16_53_22]|nr:MAG: hypothetical protein A2W25_00705 [candidate division Zixibacteria bacterium RBG_16_53_22]